MQTVGAIVPNRVDVAAVHFCHADYRRATGTLAPVEAAPLHRLNSTVSRALALAAERWCYRPSRTGVLSAVSAGVARATARHYPGVPVAVVPNGVDLERFRPDPGARAELRRGTPEGETVAVFVGGDWDRKGLGVALRAMALLRDGGRAVGLWVVGEGDEERFGAEAERLGIADRVTFFGARRDVERWFQAADVFVLPTLYETFSLVAHEAAACGLPVVATPVHGIDELAGAGEAGLLVEPNATEVAAALARLVDDPGLRRRLGDEGRRRVASLTWERCTDEARALLEDQLREAPERGRRPVRAAGRRRRSAWSSPRGDGPTRCDAASTAWPASSSGPTRSSSSGGPRTSRPEPSLAASPMAEVCGRSIVDAPGASPRCTPAPARRRAGMSSPSSTTTPSPPGMAASLAAHYNNPAVGAVGGRDVVHVGGGSSKGTPARSAW